MLYGTAGCIQNLTYLAAETFPKRGGSTTYQCPPKPIPPSNFYRSRPTNHINQKLPKPGERITQPAQYSAWRKNEALLDLT